MLGEQRAATGLDPADVALCDAQATRKVRLRPASLAPSVTDMLCQLAPDFTK